jgi:hypothetical protein
MLKLKTNVVVIFSQAAGDSFSAYKIGKGNNSKLFQELNQKYNK